MKLPTRIRIGNDIYICSQRRSRKRMRKRLMREHKDQIPGGKADGKKPEDFDPKQIEKGIKVEMEHTDDPNIAREIVLDHLMEAPDYYDHLEKMEKKFES